MKYTNQVLGEVLAERKRQDEKWGEQNHDPITWLGILVEEVGELAKAIIETVFISFGSHGGIGNIRREAIDVAAVAVAIVECLDRAMAAEAE